MTHEWYAVLTDGSGNSVTSATRTVRRMQHYPITYDLAGGTAAGDNPAAYTADDGPIVLAAPTRAGFEFAGWIGTDLDDAVRDVKIPTGSTGERAYEATWRRIDYKVGYDLDGGLVSQVNPRRYHVESEAITLVNPTRSGHEFIGWVGTDLTEPALEVRIPAGSLGDRSYTAVWETRAPEAVGTHVQIGAVTDTTHGRSATVTVHVTDVHDAPVDGEVVYGGPGASITAELSDGRATFTLPTELAAGRHVFAVTYTGTTTHKPSSSTGVLRVAKAAGPVVKVKVIKKKGGKKLRKPRQVRLVVRPSNGTAAPTGKIRIVATGTIKKNGKKRTVTKKRTVRVVPGASKVRLPKKLKVGSWKVRAVYLGDKNLASTTSTVKKFRVRKK